MKLIQALVQVLFAPAPCPAVDCARSDWHGWLLMLMLVPAYVAALTVRQSLAWSRLPQGKCFEKEAHEATEVLEADDGDDENE